MKTYLIPIKKGLLLTILILLLPFSVMGAIQIQDEIVIQSGVDTIEVPLTLDAAGTGLSGYKLTFNIDDPDIALISQVDIPQWAALKTVDEQLPAGSATFSAVDLKDEIQTESKNLVLATVKIERVKEGTTPYTITIHDISDDSGNLLNGIVSPIKGTVNVKGSSAQLTDSATVSTPVPTPDSTPIPGLSKTVPNGKDSNVDDTKQKSLPQATPTPVPTVKADFITDVRNGSAPMTVFFTDNSTGYPDKFSWDFGDGSSDNTSVLQNPQHIYRIPGIYPVTLFVSNNVYNDSVTKDNYISISSLNLGGRVGKNTSTTIFSVPENAEVYLDNAYFGLTPVVIDNLTTRNYQLRLHKDGYYDTVQTVFTHHGVLPTFISGFELMPHLAEMGVVSAAPPQTGAAYIVSYPELVNVKIDNTSVGKTDIMVMNLGVGSHNLTLSKEGYESWNDTLEVKNGLAVIQTYHFEEPYFPYNRTVEYVQYS